MSLGTATLKVELELSSLRSGMRNIESLFDGMNSRFSTGLNSSLSNSLSSVNALGMAFSSISRQIDSLSDGLNRALGEINFSNVLDIGVGVESFIEIEKLQNTFKAIATSAGASAIQIDAVNKKAFELALVTSKSPEQVAALSIELARAGFTSDQVTKSLEGVVRGSEATGESLSTIGRIVGATLNQFQLSAEESLKISDILSATANNSATTVSVLGESFKYVGTVAFNSNQSIEDMAIAVGLLGDAGLRGGQGGRNLAAALSSLNEVVGRLAIGEENAKTDMLAALGLDIDDLINSQGELKSIIDLLPTFQSALSELRSTSSGAAQEGFIMQQLFGVQGQRAISSLLTQTGEDVDRLREKVYQAGGTAREMSEIQLAGLSGSIALLQGKFSAVSSIIGSTFAPAVKSVVDVAGSLSDIFISLPTPIQHTAVLFATLGPAAFLAAKGLGAIGINLTAMAPQLLLATTGIATIAALMERSEGSKLAASLSTARGELERFYIETGKAPIEGAKVTSTLDRIKENFSNFGLAEGARQSIAQGFQSIGDSLSDTQIKALGFVGFLGGPLAGALTMTAANLLKNTDATTAYGNAFSFLTAQQRGNQLAMLEIDKLLDVTSSRYQEYLNLMMNQAAGQDEVNRKARELIPIFEQNVAVMSEQLAANSGMAESQKALLQAEIDRQKVAIDKMREKAGIAVESHRVEAESFSDTQEEMVTDFDQAQRDMIAKLEDNYRSRVAQAEMNAKQEMIAIKQAYASGQMDREAHNKALADIDNRSAMERQKIAESELSYLESAYSQQKISFEDYADQKTKLLLEIQRTAEQAADAEIRKLEELKNAYQEKLAIMNEELGLQQDLNDLAIAQAKASGADDLAIAQLKLNQLIQIQESERERLEIQLAQNLASADDKANQEEINALLRERLSVQQEVARTVAESAIKEASKGSGSSSGSSVSSGKTAGVLGGGGGGTTDYDSGDIAKARVNAIKEAADAQDAVLDVEINKMEIINTLRDREIEVIGQSIEALQHKADMAKESGNLEAQYAAQKEILKLESEQNIINTEQAVQEAHINLLKAEQAGLTAQASLQEAKANNESKTKIDILNKGIEIANSQIDLAKKQVEWAKEDVVAVSESNARRNESLLLQQKAEQESAKLAANTDKAKSSTEGMASSMSNAADSAGRAASAMGEAAAAVRDLSGGSGNQGKGLVASSSNKNTTIYKDGAGEPFAKLGASGSSSTSRSYANVDLADIAKRELELAGKIAEANGQTAKAQAIRDQIASENKKMELKALQDEAKFLQEQRALYNSERQRFIEETIAVNKSFRRATGVPTLRNFEQEAVAKAEKIFGGIGGLGDLSGGKSMQLLSQALQGFNPQIQQQQMKSQEQMGKAIEKGQNDVVKELKNVGGKLDSAMRRPTEVNISGSEDIGGDVTKTLRALQIAQR